MDLPHPLHRGSWRALLMAAAAIALIGSLAMLGERGILPPRVQRPAPAIPGVTVEDDGGDTAAPVVTSLRSDGEAERLGLRVGDRIAAVDDQPVRDVAALSRAVRARGGSEPLWLHIRRGDAVWTLAIDRAEPGARDTEPHDPQDPAG